MSDYSLSELKSKVGTSKKTVENFEIEAGKVEEFARAIKDEDPIFRDEDVAQERGFTTIPAPLTFTRVIYFPRYRPDGIDLDFGFDLGMDPEYTVHGEQTYEFNKLAHVGDTLHADTTITDAYQREGERGGEMTFVEFETEYRNQHGDHVLTERPVRIETADSIDGEANR
jgi:acyl dehydratase